MTKIGKDFVFSLKFFVFSAERDRAAFLTRLVVFAEGAEPRSLQGWWFLRNGQSRVPYRVRYGRTTVRNTLRVFRVNNPTHTVTYNGNRIAPIAERAEPRSLRGWWFLRNGQSHVPYRVPYGRTTVRNIPLGVPLKQTHPYNELRRQTNRTQPERAEPRSLQGEVR